MDNFLFLGTILATNLMVTAGVIGLLAWLSNKLRFRPWAGFLILPMSGGVLLTTCSPLLMAGTAVLGGILLYGDFSTLPHALQFIRWPMEDLGSRTLLEVLRDYQIIGCPAAFLGTVVGLLVYPGTFLWKSGRSRFHTLLGLVLLLLAWIVLGAGFTLIIFFLASVVQ